jgi:hypothetical protein
MKQVKFDNLYQSLMNFHTAGKVFWKLFESSDDLTASQLLTINAAIDQYEAWCENNIGGFGEVVYDSK